MIAETAVEQPEHNRDKDDIDNNYERIKTETKGWTHSKEHEKRLQSEQLGTRHSISLTSNISVKYASN